MKLIRFLTLWIVVISVTVAVAKLYVLPFGATTQSSIDYYVDPAGNDACNGTSPSLGSTGNCAIKTLARAEALQKAAVTANPNKSYTFSWQGGIYPQTASVIFTTADTSTSGTVQHIARSMTNKPHIDGGRPITGWVSNGDGTYHATAPGTWPATGANAGNYFGSIYVNGIRREHPIVPDKGSTPFASAANGTFVYGIGAHQSFNCTNGVSALDVSPGNVLNFAPFTQVNFGAATPCGFSANTIYYIRDTVNVGSSTIEISATSGGSAVVPSASASGTMYFTQTAANNYANNQTAAGVNQFTYTTGGSCAATGAGTTFVPAAANMCASSNAGWTITGDEKIITNGYGTKGMLPIAALDSSHVTLATRLISSGTDQMPAGAPFKRINFAVDCCQPGHFYLSRTTGRIDYNPMPTELASFQAGTASVYAPYAKELIRISNAPNDCTAAGVSCTTTHPGNMIFQGFVFEHTNTPIDTCETTPSFQTCGWQDSSNDYLWDSAITLIGASNVTFDRSLIQHTGEGGLNAIMGSSYWTVSNSECYDTGAGCIIGGGGFSGQRNGGVAARQSYEYRSSSTWPATNAVGQLYLHDDAGSTSSGESHQTITSNYIHDLPALGGSAAGVLLLTTDHLLYTGNTVKNIGFSATIFAQSINTNKFDSNETRAGYVAWNRFENGGTEIDTSGAYHNGYYCGQDMGLRYSYGNIGGTGIAGDIWVEEHNVYSTFTSCAYPNVHNNAIVSYGTDYSPAYFDGQSSFNYTFQHNIVAWGSNRCNQITGLYGAQWLENIIYCGYSRGVTSVSEADALYISSATQFPPFGPPPSYPWSTPQYLIFNKNVVVINTGGAITSNYPFDGQNSLSSNPSYASMASNYYQQIDGAPKWGGSTTFAAWQALSNPAGGTQDTGSSMVGPLSIQAGANFVDQTFTASTLFDPSGSATLCSDGVQRSPACAFNFTLWNPSLAGVQPSTGSGAYGAWANYPQDPNFFPIAYLLINTTRTWAGGTYANAVAGAIGTGMNTALTIDNQSGGGWLPTGFGTGDLNGSFATLANAGIYIIPDMNSSAGVAPEDLSNGSVASEKLLAQTMGHSKMLIGYNIGDEPQSGSCTTWPMSAIPGQITTYSGYDATRPTFFNSTNMFFGHGVCIPANAPYITAMPVFSLDQYPVVQTSNLSCCNGTPLDQIWTQGYSIQQASTYRTGYTPIWAFVETGGMDSRVTNGGASCSTATNRCTGTNTYYRTPLWAVAAEDWTSIINGATGLEYFCFDNTAADGTCVSNGGTTVLTTESGPESHGTINITPNLVAANLTYINGAIKSYAAILNTTSVGFCTMINGTSYTNFTTSCSGGILSLSTASSLPAAAMVKSYNGALYLFLQPQRNGSNALTVTLSGYAGKTATIVYDTNAQYDSANNHTGATFTLNGSGQFTDTLAANNDNYETKIYRVQ